MSAALLVEIFISTAVSLIVSLLFRESTPTKSPTYSDQMVTQISNTMPVPLIYGTVKQAGNMLWSHTSDDKTWCYKVISFGYGQIKDITDVRINDLIVAGQASNPCTALFIWNNSYPGAYVTISGNVLYLRGAGSFNISIGSSSWESIASAIWQCGSGWQATSQGLDDADNNANYLYDLSATGCYNSPVGLKSRSTDSYYENSAFRKYLGTGSQPIDDIVTGATQTDKAKLIGGLKWDAYLAVWAKASDQINGDYNVTAVVHGRLVRIYTSPTSYYIAWSDNPVWCILDFLTCYNGVGLDYSQIDIQSFINSANYCDELITNLDGTKQKRFTLNLVIDSLKSRLDWISDMMRTCCAYPTYQNGKYGVMIERPQSVVQTFDSTNINDLEMWWSPMEEVVDVLHLKYVDPSFEWAKVIANAEADKYLREFPFIYDIEILAVTNFSQASRLAWYYLNQSQTCTAYCKFKTDRRALSRTIGDIITISDYIVEWQSKQFRIMQMSEAQDDKIEVTCREYNPAIYTDAFGSVKPTVNYSKLPNPFDKPQTPSMSDISQSYYIQKDKRSVMAYFTVTMQNNGASYRNYRYWYSNDKGLSWKYGGISEESTFNVYGMEIGKSYLIKVCVENFYGVLSDYCVSGEIAFIGNNLPPSTVSNFSASETIGGFNLSWKANTEPDLDGYVIYVNGDTNGIFVTSTSYFYSASSGMFTFVIRAIDTAGNLSEAVSEYATVSVPSQVQGFNAYQNGSDLEFVWEQNSGENVSYEIRRGQSWELGEVIARVNGGFSKMTFAPSGSHTFWIKSKSIYGVYCVSPTWSTIDVAPSIDRNCILTIDPTYTWGGKIYNCDIVSGGLQLKPNVGYGEYIQPINLPFSCTARNWIDSSIMSVVVSGVTWGDISYDWDDPRADSAWLINGYTTDGISLSHQISTYQGVPTSVIEAFPLNDSLIGTRGTAVTRSDKVTYASGRYNDGAFLKDNTFIKWDTVNIPSTFSMAFTFKLDTGISGDVGFVTFKNSNNEWMLIGYNSYLDKFYSSSSDGKIIYLPLSFTQQDYVTLGISQTSTTRRLLGYSLSSNRKVAEETPAQPFGVFTSMALYANI